MDIESEKRGVRTTTFVLTNHLHTQMKMMCVLTNKSMGEFIRLSIIEKINQVKSQHPK